MVARIRLHGSQLSGECRYYQNEFRLAAEQPTSSSYAESCEQRSDAHDSCQRSRSEETRRATVIGEVVAGRTESAQPSRRSSTDPLNPWPVSQADGPEPTTVPKRYSTRLPTTERATRERYAHSAATKRSAASAIACSRDDC